MKKFIRPAATLTLLAAIGLPALAAGNGSVGGGVAIAVGPRHPAVASVLLGGGTIAPTVHKQSADFGVIATALTRGDEPKAGDAVQAGGSNGGGKAPRPAAPSTGRR